MPTARAFSLFGHAPHLQLREFQRHFADLIIPRIAEYKASYPAEGLPTITEDLLGREKPEWLAIPGMYGGFAYQLFKEGVAFRLHTECWNCIIGGSEQAHDITAEGTTFSGWLNPRGC